MKEYKRVVGSIIGGSLADGLDMRVAPGTDLASIKTGKFVSVISDNYRFFSLITNLKLEAAHADILLFPPTAQEGLLHKALQHRDLFATALLRPMLMINEQKTLMPVKMIPKHFCPVHQATGEDIALIFGNEDDPSKNFFKIGSPLDMDAAVCINLPKLTERSNGIFGKTGTGKTFITRLVLAGLIKNDKAVNLIFDMHNEYGLQARKESKDESFVKGLKTLFGSKIAIFSLDSQSTRLRGGNPDVEMVLGYRSIQLEDIISLNEELNLHPTACEAAYLIAAKYKRDWLSALLTNGDRLKEFAQELGAHAESIAALYRKLKQIERLPFFSLDQKEGGDSIDQMLEYIDRGISIIVEFGNYTSSFCYLLVANIITRRIHAAYIKKTEQFLGTRRPTDEPKKLMITIEEAHKFLNPQAARQTIFGIIAREMRKYYVSLLVVDQRPSGIDPEILSQIGTKIIAQLNDEKDIHAVLNGMHNSNQLKTILASLDSKKQVLLAGHAVTMPLVIQTREYDSVFYADMTKYDNLKRENKQLDELITEIF
jgi:DNA helicase HerA-like ATPase